MCKNNNCELFIILVVHKHSNGNSLDILTVNVSLNNKHCIICIVILVLKASEVIFFNVLLSECPLTLKNSVDPDEMLHWCILLGPVLLVKKIKTASRYRNT